MMKIHHLLFGILCFSGSTAAATSQYPCTNALYYARSLGGDNEFLVCQTQPDILSILYGAIKWHIPDIDVLLNEEDVKVTKDLHTDGECEITFQAVPYRLVLSTQVKEFLGEDTLTLYYQEQQLKKVQLDKATRIDFLHELEIAKDSCEKV